MDERINPQQKVFLQYLALFGEGQEEKAALRANYSPQKAKYVGKLLMEKQHMQDALQELIDERAKRLEFKIDDLARRVEAGMAQIELGMPVLDAKGKLTGQYVFTPAHQNALIKSAECIANLIDRNTGKDVNNRPAVNIHVDGIQNLRITKDE